MTKRLSSKLLSVILALAICATTVFGCLMTVSAADAPSLTFGAGISTDAELTKAKIPLTITLGNADGFTSVEGDTTYGGIVAGQVALSYEGITLTDVTVTSGTKVDTDYSFNADEFSGNGAIEISGNGFIFNAVNADDVYYSVLTFELSFTLASPASNGDKLSVTASSASIASPFDTMTTLGAASGTIVMGCDHKIEPVGTPIKEDTVNGYAIYENSVCTGKCKAEFGMQVVPTKLSGRIDVLAYYPTQDAATAAGSTDRYVDTRLADNGETGTDWENAIIIDSALELSYLARYAGDETKGKYYKVADGIAGFDMSGGTIDLDGTLEENLTAITTSGKRHDAGETYFQGHFDGNGATVYGLIPKYDEANGPTPSAAGLFAYAMGNVTIKNVNVSLSYLKAKHHAGGIVGRYLMDIKLEKIEDNTLVIENCAVTDSHIETTGSGMVTYTPDSSYGWVSAGTGAIYGGARGYGNGYTAYVTVKNCFINLDEEHFVSLAETQAVESVHGGIGGTAVSGNATFSKCIVIGIKPYSTFNLGYRNTSIIQHTGGSSRFSDIYTDVVVGSAVDVGYTDSKLQDFTTCMTQLSLADMKGEDAKTNMPNLDWNVWQVDVNRGYPKLAQKSTGNVNAVSDYDLTLLGTNNEYKNDGTYNFNFYYRPNGAYTNDDIDLYVAQLGENNSLGSFRILKGEVLESTSIEGLQAGDIRYTIENLSAREISNTLLATAVVNKDGEAQWGDTAQISIAKYAEKIIDGDYDEADKNLAEAVLKYGKAAKLALSTKNDSNTGKTIHWNGGTDSDLTNETHAYSTQDGSASNPIIIDSAEELAYLVQMPYAETQGNYYKIADGISNIVLQKEEHDNGIMQLTSQSKVKEYFANNSKTAWVTNYAWQTPTEKAFYGNFDGNGATVYGLYGNGANSLFGAVMAPAVIKNLAVRNCYMSGSNFGAVISSCVTLISDTSEEKNKNNRITFENIEIINCRMEVSGVGNKNVGLLSGTHAAGANVTVNNLLVYGCEIFCTADSQVYTRLSGETNWNNAATGIKNSVILDCSVTEPGVSGLYNYSRSAQVVENVYSSYAADHTNNSKITYITNEQAMGVAAVTNLSNLDWFGTWCYSSTYPSLAKGTYTSSSSTGKTIYWNGTEAAKFFTDTDGTSADNPIIINTAEEFAYVATATYGETAGRYFKMADGIDKVVLQSESIGKGIVSLDSAQAVKEYFEPIVASDISSKKNTLKLWLGNTWNPANMCFGGTFDGNGVEFYGMYNTNKDVNTNYAHNSAGGLFCIADGATITNLSVKNSYTDIGASSSGWCFGLIVSYGKDKDDSGNKTERNIYINRCTVANNYINKIVADGSMNLVGVVCGQSSDGPVIMQNLMIYGNSARCTSSSGVQYDLPVIGGAVNSLYADDTYKSEHPDWVNGDNPPRKNTVLQNSVVLGTPLLATSADGTTILNSTWCVLSAINAGNDCYENVYTDWDVSKVADIGNFKKDFFLANGGHIVNASDLVGDTDTAKNVVNTFNTSNGDTVWYTGNGTMLGFNPPSDMLPSAQAAYDAITFTNSDVDVYNEDNKTFGIYATSLNLKTNPYISFAFAFSGEYKSNRDKIKVTFTYNGGSKEVLVEKDGALLDGWSNSSGDRFHIYRFEDIPVEALNSPITVTVDYNRGAKTVTGTFSVKGFGLDLINAYNKKPCDYYATRIEAVKALLFYTQMLQARYGN